MQWWRILRSSFLGLVLAWQSALAGPLMLSGRGGAAGAAAPITIENVSAIAAVSSSSSITIASYAVPAGANKILGVCVSIEDSTTINTITGVTHNSVAMTQRANATQGTDPIQQTFYYDLQVGSSTPSGDVVASFNGNLISRMVAFTVTNATQQAPEATNSANNTASPLNTAITTATANAMIVDCHSNNSANDISITQGGSGQTLLAATSGDATSQLGASRRAATTVTSYTLGWTSSSWARAAHVLAAYENAP